MIIAVLRSRFFYEKTLIDNFDGEILAEIVKHMCFYEYDLSLMVANILCVAIFNSNYKNLSSVLSVLKPFLLI